MATKKKAAKNKPRKNKPAIVQEEVDDSVKRRADWEYHHALIYSNFIAIANKNVRYPTLKEIAEASGFSITTVFEHMEEMDLDAMKKKYSIFTEGALFKMSVNAASGKSVEWSKLFFQVMHGIGDKKQVDLTSAGKRIGSVDLSNLSDEDLLALKSIKQKVDAK